MNKYLQDHLLNIRLAEKDVLIFCPPWPTMLQERRHNTYTRMMYRFGYRRSDSANERNPSLNGEWLPLDIYHKNFLPNETVCIIDLPRNETVITYVDVLDIPSLRLHSFVHLPEYDISQKKDKDYCYTPFPVEHETISTVDNDDFSGFDLARAVDPDTDEECASEIVRLDTARVVGIHTEEQTTSKDTSYTGVLQTDYKRQPLQGTKDGYYWIDREHWLTVRQRLGLYNQRDHINQLTRIVLDIRNTVQEFYSSKMTGLEGDICEVQFQACDSTKQQNVRRMPTLSYEDMQYMCAYTKKSLALKGLMSTNVPCQVDDNDYNKFIKTKDFQPLVALVSDPWLVFVIKNFIPQSSVLFNMLYMSGQIQKTDAPVIFAVREQLLGGPDMQYVNLWTDTDVAVTMNKEGKEGIPIVKITSSFVVYMKSGGMLGENIVNSGGLSSSHGQGQHTTTIILDKDRFYTYDDTIPFLINVCKWDIEVLADKLKTLFGELMHIIGTNHYLPEK